MHGAIITAANLSVQESAAKGDKNGDGMCLASVRRISCQSVIIDLHRLPVVMRAAHRFIAMRRSIPACCERRRAARIHAGNFGLQCALVPGVVRCESCLQTENRSALRMVLCAKSLPVYFLRRPALAGVGLHRWLSSVSPDTACARRTAGWRLQEHRFHGEGKKAPAAL
jgi:hypothetical protein